MEEQLYTCVCRGQRNRNCLLCDEKGRDKIKHSHCMNCCPFCPECGKRGHQTHNDDGSIRCPGLMTCGVCEKKGHPDQLCRLKWCTLCRSDGSGDKFIGHNAEQCFKLKHCNICGVKGHGEKRCPKKECAKCHDTRHSTEQCERDIICNNCNEKGHSAARCKKCKDCGTFIHPERLHRCRRENGICKDCGSKGKGKCDCNSYIWKR